MKYLTSVLFAIAILPVSSAEAQQLSSMSDLLGIRSGVEAVVEMTYYTEEPCATLIFDLSRIDGVNALRASATIPMGNGQAISTQSTIPDAGVLRLKLPITNLPLGAHEVQLSILSGERIVWRSVDQVVKRPAIPPNVRKVQIDRYRRVLVVDGIPFFPCGVFGVPPEELHKAAEAGFNLTMRWKGTTTAARYDHSSPCTGAHNYRAVRDYLDQVHEAGLYAIEAPVKLVEESLYVKFRDPGFHEKSRIVNQDITPGVVRNARTHPAIIGYYSYDEPDNFYPTQPEHPKHLLMQKEVEQWYDVVHELDPAHPVWTLFAVDLTKVRQWNAWDVALRDFYIHTDQHMSQVYETARSSVDIAWQRRTPFVFTPLFEKSSGRAKPLSPEEQRAQTYLTLTADVKGIFYWEWAAAYSPNWTMLRELASEVETLASVLLERTPDQDMRYTKPDTQDSVKAIIKVHAGKTYLIAVNAEPAEVLATFTFPEAFDEPAEVLFEGRNIHVTQGRLHDRFAPYDRHVYVFDAPRWQPGDCLTLSLDVGEQGATAEPQCQVTADRLIANGSFEHDYANLPGWPYAWSPADTIMESGVTDAEDRGRWAVVNDIAHHGQRSMRLIRTAPGIGGSNDAFNLAKSPAIEQSVEFLHPGTYTFSSWLRSDRPVRVWMMAGWSELKPIEVGRQWRRYELTFERRSSGTGFIRIYLMQQGTLWGDAVQLERHDTTDSLPMVSAEENK